MENLESSFGDGSIFSMKIQAHKKELEKEPCTQVGLVQLVSYCLSQVKLRSQEIENVCLIRSRADSKDLEDFLEESWKKSRNPGGRSYVWTYECVYDENYGTIYLLVAYDVVCFFFFPSIMLLQSRDHPTVRHQQKYQFLLVL